jgi:predicted phage terminase large subunit-like protein
MFGISLRKDMTSLQDWRLEQGGGYRAAGIGGDIMGRGASLLSVDEYFKDVEAALSEVQRDKLYEWYLSTSSTRLAPDGAIVLMATRWHGKDLIGRVLADAEQTGEAWRVVNFPALGSDGSALWPEQWPATVLEKRKQQYYVSGYPWMWDALYQQTPPTVLDAEWPQEYFADIWADRWPEQRLITVVALDPSLGKTDKSDYSAYVCVAKGKDYNYYVDANIGRRPSSQMVEDGIVWMDRFRPNAFGVEINQFQELLMPLFRSQIHRVGLTELDCFGINNDSTAAKLVRIRRLTDHLAKRRIKFIRSPGTSLLVEQLRGFPSHKYDDGPDALEMAVRLCEELLGGTIHDPSPEVLVA